MRHGQTWVYSDTLGVVRSRDGKLLLTRVTRDYPKFFQLLCAWIRDARPVGLKENFPFTYGP